MPVDVHSQVEVSRAARVDDDHEPCVLTAGACVAPGYAVVGHLQRGRSLDIYDVWSEERACRCVAKLARPDRHDKGTHERLINEGRLLGALTHPHIVRAYEMIHDPAPVLILETLTGTTLRRAIEHGRLQPGSVAMLGVQLCSALRYLHARHILHIDLKPSNIISACGVVKVLDLSLAQPPGAGHPGRGTRQYLAPEQARGGVLSAATDVWGLGAVLFEATTGQRPFQAFEGARYDQLERGAEPVGAHRRVPPDLARAIDACLARDPEQRPTLASLADLLRRVPSCS
jgi:eukaryotic-like serine/threonine-protein kinase